MELASTLYAYKDDTCFSKWKFCFAEAFIYDTIGWIGNLEYILRTGCRYISIKYGDIKLWSQRIDF